MSWMAGPYRIGYFETWEQYRQRTKRLQYEQKRLCFQCGGLGYIFVTTWSGRRASVLCPNCGGAENCD